jgi:hypothetical protein
MEAIKSSQSNTVNGNNKTIKSYQTPDRTYTVGIGVTVGA